MDDNLPTVGQDFDLPDIERLGFFAEMGYLVGTRYTPNLQFTNIRDPKKRQMFPGPSQLKSGLQDGYFDEKYNRIFIGEGYPRRKNSGKTERQVTNRPFIPSNYPQPLHNPGDAFGYFSQNEAFSPKCNEAQKKSKEPRGIFTNPGKLGGPGFVDIGINLYPAYIPEPYEPKPLPKKKGKHVRSLPIRAIKFPNYFDKNPFFDNSYMPHYKKLKEIYVGRAFPFIPSSPGKKDGGCHAGTIEKFPEYIEDRYFDPRKIDKRLEELAEKKRKKTFKDKKKTFLPFIPPTCCKTWQCHSIMKGKVDINVHTDNWTDIKPITYTQKYTNI